MRTSARQIAVFLLLFTVFAASMVIVTITVVTSKAAVYNISLEAEAAANSLQSAGLVATGAEFEEAFDRIFREIHDPMMQSRDRLAIWCLIFMTVSGVALLLYVWPTPRRIRTWMTS